MQKDNFDFPFQYYFIPSIGKIFTPTIPIKLNTKKGLVEFQFIVDTGADLTTLPFYMASQLGIDLTRAKKSQAEGIGGFKVKTWLTKVELIFPKETVKVRASITNENSTPFLLGRVDLLDTFQSWHFDSKRKKIIFETI